MRRVAALTLLLLCGGVAEGQEFDIFQLSDFVDPRVRGTEYAECGVRTKQAGSAFLVSRLSIGAVSDYYWRTSPSGTDVAVFQNATSYYWGANQLNLKLTHLTLKQDDVPLPQTRGAVQFARYTALPNPMADRTDDAPQLVISRYLVGLAVEESPDALENLEGHRALNYELAAEFDVRVPRTAILGTLSYVKRFAGEGQSTQRFAYVVHTALYEYRRINFDMSLAAGAQKTDSWRWGDLRPTVRLRMPLDKVGTVVHAAYAPTVSFEGGFAVRHEVALFVDRAIFARVFSPAPPASRSQSRR